MARSTFKFSTTKTSKQISEAIATFMQQEGFYSTQCRGEDLLVRDASFLELQAFVKVEVNGNEIEIKAWYGNKSPLKKRRFWGMGKAMSAAMSSMYEMEYDLDNIYAKSIPDRCLRDPVNALIAALK